MHLRRDTRIASQPAMARLLSRRSKLGQTARALAYFQQSERLGGRIDGIWQFYKAAALLSAGQTSEAKTCLQETSSSVVSDGTGSAIFDKLKEFDSIRKRPGYCRACKTLEESQRQALSQTIPHCTRPNSRDRSRSYAGSIPNSRSSHNTSRCSGLSELSSSGVR